METLVINGVKMEVSRNDITLPLQKETFGAKNEDLKGQTYFSIEVPEPKVVEATVNGTTMKVLTNIDALLWAGLDTVSNLLSTSMRRIGVTLYKKNLTLEKDDKGVVTNREFDLEGLIEDWADFTAGRETLEAFDDKIDALSVESEGLLNHEKFADDSQEGEDMVKKVRANAQVIKQLRADREVVQAKFNKAAEKRAATKAAKKAKEAQAAGTAVAA